MCAIRYALASCLAFNLALVACNERDPRPIDPGDGDEVNDEGLPGRVRIRVVHASPDAGSLSFTVAASGEAAEQLFDGTALDYTNLSAIDTVDADVELRIAGQAVAGGSTVAQSAAITLSADKTYLVIFAGYASPVNRPVVGAQLLQVVVLEEGLATPPAGIGRAQLRFANAAFDVSPLAIDVNEVDRLTPFFSMVGFGEATPIGGSDVLIGSRRRFTVFSADGTEAMFTFPVADLEQFTAIAIGSRARPLNAADGLRLILVPAARTSLTASSPVGPDAAVYLMQAYPEFATMTFAIGYGDAIHRIDQDPNTPGEQPTGFGEVTPRVFVTPNGIDGERQLTIELGSGPRYEYLPPMASGSTNLMVFTGFETPGSNQQPLTMIGSIVPPVTPTNATANVTLVQAGSDADVLTFALSGDSYSASTGVAFAGVNATAALGVPTTSNVTLNIDEASFTKSFALLPGTPYVLVSYGITAVTGHSFRCGLLPFTTAGQLGPVVTLIE